MAQTVAILPVRHEHLLDKNGDAIRVGGVDLLTKTIASVLPSQKIDILYVSTDTEEIAKQAQNLGALAPFLRPKKNVHVDETIPLVLSHSVSEIEKTTSTPIETVVFLSCYYPFRHAELIDQVIDVYNTNQFESVFTVKETSGNYWYKDTDGEVVRVFRSNYYSPRDQREPLYRELMGLVCVTDKRCISEQSIIGKSIGVVPVHDAAHLIDLRDPTWKQIHSKTDVSKLFV